MLAEGLSYMAFIKIKVVFFYVHFLESFFFLFFLVLFLIIFVF